MLNDGRSGRSSNSVRMILVVVVTRVVTIAIGPMAVIAIRGVTVNHGKSGSSADSNPKP